MAATVWQQMGGTTVLTTDTAAHRVVDKGRDPSNLGRWCWTRYKGRSNCTLRIYTAYCPNPLKAPILYTHSTGHTSYSRRIQDAHTQHSFWTYAQIFKMP
jgi:hypothetical protein